MTSKKRRPDKRRLVEAYFYEVKARGEWGAYTRTAASHGVSDETVRRAVKAATEPEPILADDLAYVPAPGERPLAPATLPQKQTRPRPKCHMVYHSRVLQASGLLCKPLRSDVANVVYLPHSEPATFHTLQYRTSPVRTAPLPQRPRTYIQPDYLAQLTDVATYMVGPVPLVAWILFAVLLWFMK